MNKKEQNLMRILDLIKWNPTIIKLENRIWNREVEAQGSGIILKSEKNLQKWGVRIFKRCNKGLSYDQKLEAGLNRNCWGCCWFDCVFRVEDISRQTKISNLKPWMNSCKRTFGKQLLMSLLRSEYK